MKKEELIREEIPLTEEGLKNKHLEKRTKKLEIYKLDRQLKELEAFLSKDIFNRQTQESINSIEEDIKRCENDKGQKLTEVDIDTLRIKSDMFKKDLEEDMINEGIRLKLSELNRQIEFEKYNLGVIEKQIREKKIISVHR